MDFIVFSITKNDSAFLDSHSIAKAEIALYQESDFGISNSLSLLSSSSGFTPSQASLFITQEIFCRWLSRSQLWFLMSHTPHTGLGMTNPCAPSPVLAFPRPTHTKWSLLLYFCPLWKKHPDSCDVFMMSYSWFYSHFVTSILIFLPKLKNLSHLSYGEGSTWICVVWSFQGSDRVAGCFCVRNLSECHSRLQIVCYLSWWRGHFLQESRHLPKPGLQATCLEESSGYMFLTVKKNYLPSGLLYEYAWFKSTSINLNWNIGLKSALLIKIVIRICVKIKQKFV